MEISIQHITTESPEYNDEVWHLREEVLRKPLGLSLKNEDLSRDKINEIIIAKYRNRVIGCVFMQPLNATEIQLRAMAVYDEWQGKGIGRILVIDAENYAQSRGYEKIILHARKVALGFYKGMGYSVTGNEFIEVGIPHFMMEKEVI